MILRQKCIGQKIRVTAPNGVKLTLTIKEEEKELYRKLGMDVFEPIPEKPKAKVAEFVITEPVKKEKKNGRSSTPKGNQ